MRRIVPAVFVFVAMSGGVTPGVRAQFDEMVKHVPSHANALFMVNAEKLFASQVAQSQGWEAQRGKRFDSGLTCIPPQATRVVIASQFDLEAMHSQWDVAIVELPIAPSLADISERFGGISDMIANTSVLRTADDAYVVRFSDSFLGAFGPGNRQWVANWLQETNSELSPYLREALGFEDAGTEIILAIDAAAALTPALVEQRLAASEDPYIKNAKVPAAEIARLLSSLKGVMLGITFGQQPYGKIKIDFGEDVTALTDIAKPLVLDALANHGMRLEEMAEWKVQVSTTHIYLDGYLDESGLTRIASLINLPTHALQTPAKASGATPPAGTAAGTPPSSSDPQKLVLESTQQYYKSIEHLLADLKSQKGEESSIWQLGGWFLTYANRIDRLPILNIDQEMLQYGQYVAQQLRNASMAIKGGGIQQRVAEVNSDNNVAPVRNALYGTYEASGAYGAYGPYGRPIGYLGGYGWAAGRVGPGTVYAAGKARLNQAFSARTEIAAQTRAGMATQVQGILEQLREAHEKIRVMMTEKYKVEF